MQRITHDNGVITYAFDSLEQYPVQSHVTTTLNFSVSRGDTPERVHQNRERLAAALGIKIAEMVRPHQVHGVGIAKVDWADAGTWIERTDGIITNTVGLPISLVFGDCVPIFFYDPIHHAMGACHAGWRGTLNGIAVSTLWAMQAAYNSEPSQIRIGIGPSIGPDSYEVGEEVLSMAHAKLRYGYELFTYPNGPDENPYFDLWEANLRQLMTEGVGEEQVEVGGIDTAQSTDDFFSHRAEHGQCGLFCMTAWLEQR